MPVTSLARAPLDRHRSTANAWMPQGVPAQGLWFAPVSAVGMKGRATSILTRRQGPSEKPPATFGWNSIPRVCPAYSHIQVLELVYL
ncbi:hypothetical protein V8C42DRAFT_310812 [Trichoderma barbatum]